MCFKIGKALKFFDIFGKRVEFKIDSQTRYKTWIGGVFSLIHISLFLFLFFSLGDNMINRTNPTVLVSDYINPSPSRTYIGKEDYFFLFGMQNSSFAHYYDETIYNVTFLQKLTYSNDNSKVDFINIPFERCSEEYLPSDPKLQDFFKKAIYTDLSNLICIKKGFDNRQFILEGSYENSFYAHIQISITECKNSSIYNKCKSKEIIESQLKSSYYAIYTTDSILDLKIFENPADIQGRNYYIQTTNNVKKGIVRYLSTIKIESDEGWIINDIKESEHYTFYSDKESFELYENTNDKKKIIVDYILRKSTYEKVYSRRYKKIQNVFAEMGGFINLSFLILFFLSRPFIDKIYYDSLINRLYNFQKDNNKDDIKRLTSLKNVLVLETKETEKSLDSNYMKQIFKPKESPLNINLWEYISSFFVKSNNEINLKFKQRNESIKYFNEKMDLTFILKKFLEIEKIKILLLNVDQYHLFQFFPKPMISKTGKILLNYTNPLDISPRKNNKIITNMDINSKTRVIKRAYKNIIEKKDPDFIDLKLLELINENIKIIFVNNELVEKKTNTKRNSIRSELSMPFENQIPMEMKLEDIEN